MKIAMFAPFFGPDPNRGLPNYYEYWLKSAAANHDIDFFIPTNLNVQNYTKYGNIYYIPMTAEEFWRKLQAIVDFPISHDFYKTGEYRMFFGIIFRDLLRIYDYWGSTEFDMIYGDILKFAHSYLVAGADVIGKTAPFRLIKNTDKLCNMPFAELRGFKHPLTLERALSTDYCWYFSEIVGMNVRYHQAGINIVPLDDYFANISSKFKYLSCIGMNGMWGFNWNHGTLTGYNQHNEEKEFMAIHLQKRKMKCKVGVPQDNFCVYPNVIRDNCQNYPKIQTRSLSYTLQRLWTTYSSVYREHKELDDEAQLITREVMDYCETNGLLPPPSRRPFIRFLHTLKRRILWY